MTNARGSTTVRSGRVQAQEEEKHVNWLKDRFHLGYAWLMLLSLSMIVLFSLRILRGQANMGNVLGVVFTVCFLVLMCVLFWMTREVDKD